jgi:hypothetical protein
MPQLTPVDYDPFATPAQPEARNAVAVSTKATGSRLTPVDYDPFAQPNFADVQGGATTVEQPQAPWYDRLGQGLAHGLGDVLNSARQAGRFLDIAGFYEPVQKPQDILGRAQDYEDLTHQLGERQAEWEKGAGGTIAGKAGSAVGQVVGTLPIGGLGAPAEGLGAMILRQAGAGAAGAALSQPVTDPDANYLAQKLGQATVGGVTGAGTGAVLRGAGRFLEELRARNLPFRQAAGDEIAAAAQKGAPPSPARDYINESDRLAQETGVTFTPGESTGSKGLMQREQQLRQGAGTADQIFDRDKLATGDLDAYIQRMLRNISANGQAPDETGEAVRNALKTKIGQLTKQRSDIADQQYGAIRQLVGGRPLIQPENLRAELANIATEYGSIATPGAKALSRFADKTAGGELGDVTNLMKLRSYLSKVAGGQARISGEPVDRKVAVGLLQSIDNDLDASADQLGGRVGDMLKAANQNYRNFSQQIEYVQRSPLGKLLGEDVTNTMNGGSYNTVPPEKIVEALKKMTPSQVGITKALMKDASPEAWQAAKRRLIEDALEQAQGAAPSAGANTLAMQPTTFVRALNGTAPQGKAWAQALLEPNELTQLRNAMGAALRLGDKTGYNFSNTGPYLEGAMKGVEDAVATTSKAALARRAAMGAVQRYNTRKLAAAMVDPKGRQALLQLEQLPPGAAKARDLTAFLASLEAPEVIEGGEGSNQDQASRP